LAGTRLIHCERYLSVFRKVVCYCFVKLENNSVLRAV